MREHPIEVRLRRDDDGRWWDAASASWVAGHHEPIRATCLMPAAYAWHGPIPPGVPEGVRVRVYVFADGREVDIVARHADRPVPPPRQALASR